MHKGAAIAQWIHLCLPSCRPGFESQAYHFWFYKKTIAHCGYLNRMGIIKRFKHFTKFVLMYLIKNG